MIGPKYRNEIKGEVAAVKRDCVDTFRGELRSDDNFIFNWRDTKTYREYADMLTERELEACFKKAIRES